MALDPKHVMRLNNRDYVLFPGLLALAHERGLDSIETVIEQIPDAGNQHTAVVRATVTLRSPDGNLRAFTCVGDASPATTKVNAYLRMAETRAIGRCFRMGLNIGETMFEELNDNEREGAPLEYREEGHSRGATAHGEHGAAGNGAAGELVCSYAGCEAELTPGQMNLSLKKYNAALCPTHQKEMAKVSG